MPTPGKYTKNQDTFHEAEDAGTTGYILTDDDGLGDPVPLIGGFGGKINQIFQNLWDNINYLRKRVGNVPDATDTQKGISERATQDEVNTGTDDERFITPLTFHESDVIQTILPAATMIVTGRNSSDNVVANAFTVEVNQVIGRIGFLRIKKENSSSSTRIRIAGGKWHLASEILERTLPAYNSGIVTYSNVEHNNNYLQFIPSGGHFTQNQYLNLILYLIP